MHPDGKKPRLVPGVDRGSKNGTHRRERIRVTAGHDRQQCVTLFGAGALVDKGRALSLALMDRPRPSEDGSDVQARKVNIAMSPLVNCHSEKSLAMTLVRKSTELAVDRKSVGTGKRWSVRVESGGSW